MQTADYIYALINQLWLGSGSAAQILSFGSVMHTGILDIPVLYVCFGLLSYLAFAKFVHLSKEVENLH